MFTSVLILRNGPGGGIAHCSALSFSNSSAGKQYRRLSPRCRVLSTNPAGFDNSAPVSISLCRIKMRAKPIFESLAKRLAAPYVGRCSNASSVSDVHVVPLEQNCLVPVFGQCLADLTTFPATGRLSRIPELPVADSLSYICSMDNPVRSFGHWPG